MTLSIEKNIYLKDHTTFRIGGPVDFFVTVSSVDELKEALLFARNKNIPWKLLGGGSNILASDRGYKGLVIKNEIKGIEWREEIDSTLVVSGSGENWDYLVGETVDRGYVGLENLSLIPGTVGAAPIQNIGAYGAEVKQTIEWVEVLDTKSGEVKQISNSECKFGYRDSIFKHKEGEDLIIIRVAFRLSKKGNTFIGYRDLADHFVRLGIARATPSEIREAVIGIRTMKLPDLAVEGTAGSFFKNPVVTSDQFDELKKKFPDLPGHAEGGAMKLSAGWIIDKLLDMKGVCVNDACVHKNQALVIVNKGNATTEDVNELANQIAQKVKEKLGVEIEREVREI